LITPATAALTPACSSAAVATVTLCLAAAAATVAVSTTVVLALRLALAGKEIVFNRLRPIAVFKVCTILPR
jgi:hypothetical protein